MWSKFNLSQEMLPMGRFPAFGRPRQPPQSRVLRTIQFKWCDKQRIVRQHKEIASGDVIWSAETSSSCQILWILEIVSHHFIYTGDASNNSQMMPGHHLNHPYSILRTSFSSFSHAGEAEIQRYLSQKWSSDGNQYLNLKRLTLLDFLVPGSYLLNPYINV